MITQTPHFSLGSTIVLPRLKFLLRVPCAFFLAVNTDCEKRRDNTFTLPASVSKGSILQALQDSRQR